MFKKNFTLCVFPNPKISFFDHYFHCVYCFYDRHFHYSCHVLCSSIWFLVDGVFCCSCHYASVAYGDALFVVDLYRRSMGMWWWWAMLTMVNLLLNNLYLFYQTIVMVLNYVCVDDIGFYHHFCQKYLYVCVYLYL